MADTSNGATKPQRIENRITLGNVLSCVGVIVSVAMAWQALRGDINALAQRVDNGDKRDEKTIEALDQLKGSVIRIETEQKAVRSDAERLGRQLDRIEQLLRSGAMLPPVVPR